MNDPVIRFPATRIPLDTRAVSAGLSLVAKEMIMVFGLVVLLLLGIAILCEVRGLRNDLEQKATKGTKGAGSVPFVSSVVPNLLTTENTEHTEGGGR